MRIVTTYYTHSGWPIISFLPDLGRDCRDGKPIGRRIKECLKMLDEEKDSEMIQNFLKDVISGLVKSSLTELQIDPEGVITTESERSGRDVGILSKYFGLTNIETNKVLNLTFGRAFKIGWGKIRLLTLTDIDTMYLNLNAFLERTLLQEEPVILQPVNPTEIQPRLAS